jgi:hypothetical protein
MRPTPLEPRLKKLLTRAPLARQILDVIAVKARTGDEAFDAIALVLATLLRLESATDAPPAFGISGLVDHVEPLADHLAMARPDFDRGLSDGVTGRCSHLQNKGDSHELHLRSDEDDEKPNGFKR